MALDRLIDNPDGTREFMGFMDYWERIRLRLEEEFGRWIPEFFVDLPASQCAAVSRTLQAGKRIRGCLVCLVCEALGGSIEDAVPRAVAIECIQAASLIHDDYVDGDTIRRDRPAEWTLQGSRHAVLLGDLMFSTVIRKMVEQDAAEGRLVAKVIAAMARGAYQEHVTGRGLERHGREEKNRRPTYDQIIHLKTGALFEAAARMGAMAAGVREPFDRQASCFGSMLGEAYQIADDLVEVEQLHRNHQDGGTPDPAIVPILANFAEISVPGLHQLLDAGSWVRSDYLGRELPRIKARMRGEIAVRSNSALLELSGFPDNRHTDLLREMPVEIVRAMGPSP